MSTDSIKPVATSLDDARELAQWRLLRDPNVLHANLLRGQPAQLTRAHLHHLMGADVAALVQKLRDVLAYHQEQTWPINITGEALAEADAFLGEQR